MNENWQVSGSVRQAPEFKALMTTYNVNVPNLVEAVWQPQFDRLTYAAVGQTELRFFQQVVGQGAVNETDTNMKVAGVIAAPQQFLATGIRMTFTPGGSPVLVDPVASANAAFFINDVNAVMNSGVVVFNVGNKEQNRDAPIGRFPPTWGLNVDSSVATTVAATLVTTGYAQNVGQLYNLTPANIPYGQNFDVTVKWPVAVPLPSNVAGKLRCHIEGFIYRSAQ